MGSGRESRFFFPRKESVGRTAADNRLFVNGVLWILRSGARWYHSPSVMASTKACISASFAGRTAASGIGSSRSWCGTAIACSAIRPLSIVDTA